MARGWLITNIPYMVELVWWSSWPPRYFSRCAKALLVGVVFGLGRTAPVGPLGASHRLTTWWGDVVYGGQAMLGLAPAPFCRRLSLCWPFPGRAGSRWAGGE